jgi:hypothetical protein
MTRLAEAADALLASPEFAAGCWWGLAAVAVALAAGFARRWGRQSEPAPIAGLLFAGATVAAIGSTLGVPVMLVLGLLALAAAGAWRMGSEWLTAALTVPGAWLVAYHSGLDLDGSRPMVAAAVVAAGWLSADFDHRWRGRALGPVLLAMTVAGVYATVPDTEQALAALGVALPLALLSWPWPLASLGRAGAQAAIGALLWVIVAGGAARPSAVVGGVACLGLLVVEPLARVVDPGRRSALERLPPGRWGVPAAAAVQLVLVYVAAEAVVIAGVELVVAVAVCLATTLSRPTHRKQDDADTHHPR